MKTIFSIQNTLIGTIIFFMVLSCSPREKVPSNFPDENEMAQILADMYFAESIVTQAKREVSVPLSEDNIPGYYHKILEQHNLSAEAFDTIRDWYSSHPYHYQNVYDKVIVILSKREADLNRAIKAKEELKDSLPAIRDLWIGDRAMAVTPQDTAKSCLPFHIEIDSIYGGQIRLSAVYKFLKEDLSRQTSTTLITQYADSTGDTISLQLTKTFKSSPITLQMDIDSLLPLIGIYGCLFDHDTSSVSSIEFSNIRLEHLGEKEDSLKLEIIKNKLPRPQNELQ
ncbi:DUF4296 domain-containing protein [Thermophagus sp. OGC60D27]|uniref:DUF4296 domain-containing protein n=1 Tax=Thermophagus sp. OGC60D27 TaxID=3458415 RepID=UPI004037B81A